MMATFQLACLITRKMYTLEHVGLLIHESVEPTRCLDILGKALMIPAKSKVDMSC